jgi:hypothetical protein
MLYSSEISTLAIRETTVKVLQSSEEKLDSSRCPEVGHGSRRQHDLIHEL